MNEPTFGSLLIPYMDDDLEVDMPCLLGCGTRVSIKLSTWCSISAALETVYVGRQVFLFEATWDLVEVPFIPNQEKFAAPICLKCQPIDASRKEFVDRANARNK